MHTRTYSHSRSTPTGTSTTTGREIRFSSSARASKRRYDGDDACAPPPIHPFPPGQFRGAIEAATLLSQCPARATSSRRVRLHSRRYTLPISELSNRVIKASVIIGIFWTVFAIKYHVMLSYRSCAISPL